MSGRLMCSFEMRCRCYSSNPHVQTARGEFGGHETSAESQAICAEEGCIRCEKKLQTLSNCSTLNITLTKTHFSNMTSFKMKNRSLLSGLLGFTLTGLFISFLSLTDGNLVKLFLHPTQASEGSDSLSRLVFYNRVLYTDLMFGVRARMDPHDLPLKIPKLCSPQTRATGSAQHG